MSPQRRRRIIICMFTNHNLNNKKYLEKKGATNEYLEALKSFEKNREFYLGFWHLIERCRLVNALNFAHEHGQLSNLQKQAMIRLLEKKDKDRRFIKNWRPISLINVDVACVASVPVRQKSFETIFRKLAARKLGQETEGTLARRPHIFKKTRSPTNGGF